MSLFRGLSLPFLATLQILGFVSFLLIPLPHIAHAETVLAIVNPETVSIHTNFTGREIVFFGSVSRDIHTISRQGNYDVIIVLRGPTRKVTIWKKKRVLGMWVKGEALQLAEIPGYLGISSNRPFAEITTSANLHRHQIGLHREEHLNANLFQDFPKFIDFQYNFLHLMKKQGLYMENTQGVEFFDGSLFVSRFTLPSNISTGTYHAEILLLADGAVLDTQTLTLHVQKEGLGKFLSQSARFFPALYGIFSIAVALAIGCIGAVFFRRD